ncbi:MAG: TIGR01777 family oxidoreductase [Bacteroidia bacterium]|nr:TIGR01777 family oxidoreductase [Bacteroidia bacterium]
MAHIILPGGTGFMGKALSTYFVRAGHKVFVLTRSPKRPENGIEFIGWDGKTIGDWSKYLEGASAVINLAGKSVNCRYTEANVKEIFDSRVESTRVLGEAIAACQRPPEVWINSSTATIYRHSEDRAMTERDGDLGTGMSVNVARAWEDSFFEAMVPGVRKVALRTAIVFSEKDGALPRLMNLVKAGMGGAQGTGKQMMSWIHMEDVVKAVAFLMAHKELEGAFNLAAPDPQPNAEMMSVLRQAMGVPLALPVPAWLLEVGAAMIGTETELLLKSRWVLPQRLLEAGFEFEFPTLPQALKNLGE